jgi:hypothetical protein
MLERNSSPRPRLGGHCSCSPEARSPIETYKLQKRARSARSTWVERARGTAVSLRTLSAGTDRYFNLFTAPESPPARGP